MKLFWYAIATVALVLGLLWWEQAWVQQETKALIGALDAVEAAIPEHERAQTAYLSYEARWCHSKQRMIFFTHHADLTEVMRLNARLEVYLKEDKKTEIRAVIYELKIMLNGFYEKEKPTLYNLF